MGSKYDDYWHGRLSEIATLMRAATEGRTHTLDVSDIRPLGNRDSWYGNATVRGDRVLSSSMAHATSLARQVVEAGLSAEYPGISFAFAIDRKPRLRVTASGWRSSVQAPDRQEPGRGPRARALMAPVVVRTALDRAIDVEAACARLHELLGTLPRYSNPVQVPFDDGLYFFYEQGETSPHAPDGRIVRIGNHPHSNHRLTNRLREHYQARFGAKNSSVFRRYLGGALIRMGDESSPCLGPTPGLGHWERQYQVPCALCAPYEAKVTTLLRDWFRFRCVRIEDQLLRNELEARLIATVGACRQCQPSGGWLGRFAYPPQVRASGLWNSQHLGGPTVGEGLLDRFGERVSESAGGGPAGTLGTTLLLIPCSAAKKGERPLGLPERRVEEFIGSSAAAILDHARRGAFARTAIDRTSPPRQALETYSGLPYATPGLVDLLAERIRQGLHCLIVSGGYGVVRAEEPIHLYEAPMQRTATVWRPALARVLKEDVARNGIRRTIACFSTVYSSMIPDHLSGDDWRHVPTFRQGEDRGPALREVPKRVGEALTELLGYDLRPTQRWSRT
jgi:hypothetical protein